MFKRTLVAACMLATASSQAFAGNTTYNVFLIPAKTADTVVNTISQQLNKEGLQSLYNQGYLAHITLYLTEYPEGSLDQIKQNAERLAKSWHPFSLTLNKIDRTKGDWLMLNAVNDQKLQRLADETTLAMEPLRAQNPTVPGWVASYPNKLASFQRYGSPNVFANFQPHFTLLAQSNSDKLDRFMLRYGNTFKPVTLEVQGIGIAEVNANGQAKKELATFYFKK